MSVYYPNDPKHEYGFYDRYNPKLWTTLDENMKIRKQLKEQINSNYESSVNGIASLSDPFDEARKKEQEEKEKQKNIVLNTGAKDIKDEDPQSEKFLYDVDEPSKIIEPDEDPVRDITQDIFNNVSKFLGDLDKKRQGVAGPVTLIARLIKKVKGVKTINDYAYKIGDVDVQIDGTKDTPILRIPGARPIELDDLTINILFNNRPSDILLLKNNRLYDETMRRLAVEFHKAGIIEKHNEKKKFPTEENRSKVQLFQAYLMEQKGSGVRVDAAMQYYSDPNELVNRLEILLGSRKAGNTSSQLVNEALGILDQLKFTKKITRPQYTSLYELFMK